ncbi:hypothetical protein ABW20_dc0103085 [Dactylellina cionopaga]|nr:hypothetical protein ABW20_dc0103085 [Dactylellina cionopaga]
MLEARNVDVCKSINGLVNLLKLEKATPFCSSFLGIKTSTVVETVATTIYPYITREETDTVTATVVDRTIVETFSTTEIVRTLPTVVDTSIVLSTAFTTKTLTPNIVTITTTVYTTPVAVPRKRDLSGFEISKRDIRLPAYIAGFASSAVSKACSCLSILTPVKTVTSTSTVPSTIYTTQTETETATSLIATTVSTTETILTTDYVPTTTITTSVTTITTTETAATPTQTVTVRVPIPSACQNLLGNLYNTVTYNGPSGGPAGSNLGAPSYNTGGETGASGCCTLCWNDINCGLFLNRALFTGSTTFQCVLYRNTAKSNNGVSVTCPNGLGGGNPSGNSVSGFSGFGKGPCL